MSGVAMNGGMSLRKARPRNREVTNKAAGTPPPALPRRLPPGQVGQLCPGLLRAGVAGLRGARGHRGPDTDRDTTGDRDQCDKNAKLASGLTGNNGNGLGTRNGVNWSTVVATLRRRGRVRNGVPCSTAIGTGQDPGTREKNRETRNNAIPTSRTFLNKHKGTSLMGEANSRNNASKQNKQRGPTTS